MHLYSCNRSKVVTAGIHSNQQFRRLPALLQLKQAAEVLLLESSDKILKIEADSTSQQEILAAKDAELRVQSAVRHELELENAHLRKQLKAALEHEAEAAELRMQLAGQHGLELENAQLRKQLKASSENEAAANEETQQARHHVEVIKVAYPGAPGM